MTTMTPEPYVIPSRVVQIGNSFGVRIPREVLDALDLIGEDGKPRDVRIRISIGRED